MMMKKAHLILQLLLMIYLPAVAMAQEEALDLTDLLNRALKKNADLLNQVSDTRISRYERLQALSQMLPQADVEAAYIKSSGQKDAPDLIGANGSKEKIAWLAFRQTIFNPELFMTIANTHVAQKEQTLLYEQTKQDVLLDVMEAYFSALQAQGEVAVLKANQDAFQVMYEQSQHLFANGLVPELDVKKSHLEYLLQQHALAQSQMAYRSTLNRVKALIGMPIEDPLALKPFPTQSVHLDSLQTYLDAAIANRPELHIARLESDAMQNEKWAARLAHFPSTDAGVYYGWDTTDPLRSNNRGWQAYINVNMPLWHWGHLHLERRIADLHYQQSETRREQLQKQIAQEVIDAFSECRIQQQHMQTMEETRAEAAETVRMAQIGYQESAVTSLDVINAQQLLTQTNMESLQAEYTFYSAKARLYRRIGNLREDFSWLE